MNRQPKTLQELQDEAVAGNEILGRVADQSRQNSRHYANPNAHTDDEEHYYTDRYSFMRQENYTINGEPVKKDGK